MSNLMSIDDCDVSLMMIINNRNIDEVNRLLALQQFKYPVLLDTTGTFLDLNSLPEKEVFHTLLLDADNKVLGAGNPVVNPKVRDVYCRIIFGDETSASQRYFRQSATAVGIVNRGDSINHTFSIANTTEKTLTIQEAVPSCECLSVQLSSDTIHAGKSTNVKVKFAADSTPGLFKRHIDIYYNEIESPERLTLHGFINNFPISKHSNQ